MAEPVTHPLKIEGKAPDKAKVPSKSELQRFAHWLPAAEMRAVIDGLLRGALVCRQTDGTAIIAGEKISKLDHFASSPSGRQRA